MKVKFKKLNSSAVTPAKAHSTDAGFDLTAISCSVDKYGSYVYSTGIAIEIPHGYVGLLFPRSSVAKKSQILSNCVGVIDSDYRGEIMLKFKHVEGAIRHWIFGGDCQEIYNVGERVGQLIIMKLPDIELEEADILSDTDRGTSGYGSTGK